MTVLAALLGKLGVHFYMYADDMQLTFNLHLQKSSGPYSPALEFNLTHTLVEVRSGCLPNF